MGLLEEQRDAIAKGERTSVELVTEAITAAEKLQPELNAFTEIYADEALERARLIDGVPLDRRGTLHGVPVAVKDLYDVAGHVTSGCSRGYLGSPPAVADSPAVAALRRAGAVVIGKTNMHELAFGATNTISCYGRTNNPWDTERVTGGSSGGSGAAVAARVVGMALGTDTGGSIRIPSSFTGASGLKTTWGLLPLYGVLPMAPSLDSVGPIASDAVDLAHAFHTLNGEPVSFWSGYDRSPPFRVGIARDPYFDAVDLEVAAATEEAARMLAAGGPELRDIPLPWAEGADDAWLTIALAEFGREHRALIDRPDDLDPTTYVILSAGTAVTPDDERRARESVVTARAAFDETMRNIDVLVIAATPFPAPRHEDQTVSVGGTELPVHLGGPSHFTRPISVVTAPAVAIPTGFSSGGLPIGVQLVGRRGSEASLLQAAIGYQGETDWHTRIPPVHA
jgi:aspartyl-tRNA(Asn)/glutamyl-tRNA(Gln) amidotransferase subunit A